MKATEQPIIVEDNIPAPAERVWRAITKPEQMRQWFFNNIPAFEAKVGFETQFNVHSGGRDFLHLWKITAVETLRKITYNWKYGGYPGDSYVTFELFGQGRQARLKLTHEVVESFPEDIPEFSRASCTEGWRYFIQKSLKEYLGEGS